MKKRFAQIAGIALAVVLVGGVILTRPSEVNEDILTAKVDVFDEETETEGSEVVIDDEDVPLASAPKVKTTTSSKTTTKKQKMKKASKKTKTTTKTKTKKSKKTVKSSAKAVTKETTVKTTVRTTVKKNSKIKTIRTTVKTTVKTTTKSLAGSNVTSGSGSGGQGSSLRQLASKADSSVLNAFETLGFELKYNAGAPYSGTFNPTGGYIELKKADSGYLLHELGHFVSFLLDGADSTGEFKGIFQSEKSKYTDSNKAYVLADSAEYFAESYKNYKENPSKLHSERPQTYAYIASCVKEITPSLVSEIKGVYGYLWK